MSTSNIPGFGSYFLALFLTPIYCISRGKWIGFILSTILYIIAGFTILIFGLGLIPWALAAVPAAFSLRNEILEAHARKTGEATAKAIASAMSSQSISQKTPQQISQAEVIPAENNSDLSGEKICPMCAETIKAAARICKHCHHEFESIEEKPIAVISPSMNALEDAFTQTSASKTDAQTVEISSSINEYATQQPSNPSPPKNNTIGYIIGVVILIFAIASSVYLYKTKAMTNKIASAEYLKKSSDNSTIEGKDNSQSQQGINDDSVRKTIKSAPTPAAVAKGASQNLTEEQRDVVNKVYDLYEAYKSKNLDSYMNNIDDNAIFRSAKYSLQGKDKIRERRVKTFAALDNFDCKFNNIDVNISGNEATVNDSLKFSYTKMKTGKRLSENVNETFKLRKIDSGWLIVENIEH